MLKNQAVSQVYQCIESQQLSHLLVSPQTKDAFNRWLQEEPLSRSRQLIPIILKGKDTFWSFLLQQQLIKFPSTGTSTGISTGTSTGTSTETPRYKDAATQTPRYRDAATQTETPRYRDAVTQTETLEQQTLDDPNALPHETAGTPNP